MKTELKSGRWANNNNNNKIVSSIAQFPLLQCSNALELDTVNQT